MRVLVDTNILLRSAQPSHSLCSLTAQAVAKLLREKAAVSYCPQNIAEFWNVATRPVAVNGLGFSTSETIQEIAGIENLLTLLPDIPAIYPEWRQLVLDHGVQGVKVFDALLVAVITVDAVDTLLTLNAPDFKRYGTIKALQPAVGSPKASRFRPVYPRGRDAPLLARRAGIGDVGPLYADPGSRAVKRALGDDLRIMVVAATPTNAAHPARPLTHATTAPGATLREGERTCEEQQSS